MVVPVHSIMGESTKGGRASLVGDRQEVAARYEATGDGWVYRGDNWG